MTSIDLDRAGSGAETAHPRSAELERFVATEYRRVVGVVALVTGDRVRAEDAVQEALVAAWRRRDEPIERLAAWITVVATNQARSGHRRRQAEQRALDRAGCGATPDVVDGVAEPFDEAVADALAGLPLRERQAAMLHYVLDMSVADCARSLGVTDGTIKTLLSRARRHLAEALTGDGADDEGDVA